MTRQKRGTFPWSLSLRVADVASSGADLVGANFDLCNALPNELCHFSASICGPARDEAAADSFSSHFEAEPHRRGARSLLKTGGFELTFSKGPGVTLLTVEQDATFAQIKGALAHGGWSGADGGTAPHRLLGWLGTARRAHAISGQTARSLRLRRGNIHFPVLTEGGGTTTVASRCHGLCG